MTSKASQPEDAAELRRQAEKVIREKAARMPENLEALSPDETRQTLHELQVHQIELEMQNEELRRAQAELDASQARYFDLYDLAPVGYFSLSEHGLILEANLTAAGLLGVARGALAKQPLPRFIFREDEDIYYLHRKQLLETGEPQVCELRMLRADAAPFWARLEATVVQDGESGEAVCRAVVSDIDGMKRVEQAVRQSHDELRAIYDGAIDGLLVADAETKRFVRVSPAMCRMLGYSEEELLSMSVMEIHPPAAVRTILGQFKAMMEGRLAVAQGCPLLRKDGTEIYADIGCKLVVFNGRPCGIGFFHDITERKQAEGLVQAANSLLSLLPETSTRKDYMDAVIDLLRDWTGCRCAGIRGVDKQGRIPYEAYAGFGQEFWSQENLLTLHRDECACTRVILGEPLPQDAPAMTPGGSFVCRRLSEFAKHLSQEEASQFRGVCIKSGFESVAVIPLRHQGQVLGVIHLADETPDMFPRETVELLESLAPLIGAAIRRLNLEEALRLAHDDLELRVQERTAELADRAEQLRALAVELTQAEQRERRRLAEILHDNLQQMLVAARMKVGMLRRRVQDVQLGQTIGQLDDLLNDTINESRSLAAQLCPPVLYDRGLAAGLEWLARQTQEKFALAVEVEVDPAAEPAAEITRVFLFQAVGELLVNVSKHAQAQRVWVRMSRSEQHVRIEVRDDGRGFDAAQGAVKTDNGGFGMFSIRERLAALGGQMEVLSSPVRGTQIMIRVSEQRE